MSSEFAISVENISKCYHIYDNPRYRLMQMLSRGRKQYFQEFWALKNVSFDVKKGQTLGIIGKNGSGKSTLLQIICGTLNQTNGSVQSNGRIAALLELGSGFNVEFTGRENVYMNSALLGLSKKEIESRYNDIVNFADIGYFIDQPVKTYSSGMFVRLAFAVIANVDADILIIDEALSVGDVFFTQKCMRFLRKFREHGTLIFVSHDVGAINGLCDITLWLDKGEPQVMGPSKIVSEKYLASLYSKDNTLYVQKTIDKYAENKQMLFSPKLIRDCRADRIDRSSLRNDLEIFKFAPGASSDFGVRGAEIKNVIIVDSEGELVTRLVGGELVLLYVEVLAFRSIVSPIIGFSLKDRLGQVLFGDNTFISYQNERVIIDAGNYFKAKFTFNMPILPCGDYSIDAAVAEGTQDEHIQHHWIYDALVVKSLSSSVSTGLIGIPMQSIEIIVN